MHTQSIDRANHITAEQFLSRMGGGPHQVRVPLSDALKQEQYEPSSANAPRSVGVPAPFTEEDSHNGRNQVLSPGQQFVVVLKDNAASSGHRWADQIVDNPYFTLLDTSYHASGDGIGAGGSRVYRFRVNEDALKWHQGQKQVPAALSIYQLAPGESFEKRSTRGDGSGPEFYLNTVIVNEKAGSLIGIRSGKNNQSEAKTLDLGELEQPGAVLAGTIQELRPGDSLQFSARVNQVANLGNITISPEGALTLETKLLDGELDGLGDRLHYQYRFTVPESTESGSTIDVKTSGSWRYDPNWTFSFQVKVES